MGKWERRGSDGERRTGGEGETQLFTTIAALSVVEQISLWRSW